MEIIDNIPMEDYRRVDGPDENGLMHLQFMAFNTVVNITIPVESDELGVETTDAIPSGADASPTPGTPSGAPATKSQAQRTQQAMQAFEAAIERCREYEQLFSRTLPHSDVSRVNRARTEAVEISPQTYELLELAFHYCDLSQGLFDITIGSASRLWDFHNSVIPSKKSLSNAISHVNWRNIEIFEQNNQHLAKKLDPQLMIDLGGIAKGYIADELATLLLGRGFRSFIINLGGNVLVHGRKPNGDKWVVGLKDPVNPNAVIGAVELENASLVTSGVYERGFVRDGVLYHHILHPKTGMPVATDALAASVVTSKSIDAEGFSTTLLAMGIEKGRAFARTRPEIIATYFVDTSGRLTVS